MGKGKKVTCGTCLRIMRRDHLKRHMKQHDKEKFGNESFVDQALVQVEHLYKNLRAILVQSQHTHLLPSTKSLRLNQC